MLSLGCVRSTVHTFASGVLATPGTSAPVEDVDELGPEPGYVLSLCSTLDGRTIAAAASTSVIKLYDAETMAYEGQVNGHTSRVNQMIGSATQPHVLYSAASDGTCAMWDTRACRQSGFSNTPAQVFRLDGRGGEEAFCVCESGDGNTLAVGTNCKVALFDVRAGKLWRAFDESFSEDVTQVKFSPTGGGEASRSGSFLITAGADGLISCFETAAPDEDDAFQAVINVGQPIVEIGFAGSNSEFCYALTAIETLSLYHVEESQCIAEFPDPREVLQADYVVGATYHSTLQQLVLLTGSDEGVLSLASVQMDQLYPLGSFGAPLAVDADPAAAGPSVGSPGHSNIVRCVDWNLPCSGSAVSFITGGEDSRICHWVQSEVVQQEFKAAEPATADEAYGAELDSYGGGNDLDGDGELGSGVGAPVGMRASASRRAGATAAAGGAYGRKSVKGKQRLTQSPY